MLEQQRTDMSLKLRFRILYFGHRCAADERGVERHEAEQRQAKHSGQDFQTSTVHGQLDHRNSDLAGKTGGKYEYIFRLLFTSTFNLLFQSNSAFSPRVPPPQVWTPYDRMVKIVSSRLTIAGRNEGV